MQRWDILGMEIKAHAPQILSTNDAARTIALALPAGERLADHQVHERAFVAVLAGEVEMTTDDGDRVTGGPGTLVEFEPRERHEVMARSDARLLLLLAPWPGDGHPGAMTLEEKATAVERAAQAGR